MVEIGIVDGVDGIDSGKYERIIEQKRAIEEKIKRNSVSQGKKEKLMFLRSHLVRVVIPRIVREMQR